MSETFTAEQIAALSADIDKQLADLERGFKAGRIKGDDEELAKQYQDIKEYAKEEPTVFLGRFGRKAVNVLCSEDSVLYRQWEKFGDLRNEDVLEKFGAVLTVMGFTEIGLQVISVAVSVCALRIGIKAFCEKYCK